jgi:hypothetical protein
MSRESAGVSDPRHRALVRQVIEDRVAQGMTREEATKEVLDQEYEWRKEEAEAASYTPVVDFVNEVLGATLGPVARRIRSARRTSPGEPGAGQPEGK